MTEQYTHFAQAVYELRWILVMAGFALMALLWLEENVRRHDAQDKREADARRYNAAINDGYDEIADLCAEVRRLRWQNHVLSIAVQSPRPSARPPSPPAQQRARLVALPTPDQKTGGQS